MSVTITNFQQMLDYWTEKRGTRIAPSRAELDPLDYPKLWADIVIYKVHSDPLDYEVTRVGTNLVEAWGKDYTGCFFDDIFLGPTKERVRAAYDEAVRTGIPTTEELDASWIDKEYVRYKRLLLPLSEDGKIIDRLFLCLQVETLA